MATIAYSQGIKVSHAQAIFFLWGQVAYTAGGGVEISELAHPDWLIEVEAIAVI